LGQLRLPSSRSAPSHSSFEICHVPSHSLQCRVNPPVSSAQVTYTRTDIHSNMPVT
jgi:hypothetical protein